MADLINFTLPTIKIDGSDDRTMKQIKNYLFQLTEQMRFYLNNIDSDNYTDDYREKMSRMINVATENQHEMTVAQKAYKEMNERLKASITDSVQLISGNKGGYVVSNDANGDGYPDEILIMDTMSKETAQSLWRWNHSGLMFSNSYNGLNASDVPIAIDMQGRINADFITAGTISAVDIEGVDITGCTITGNTIQGNVIYATDGYIGGWELSADKFSTASGYFADVEVNNDVYEINLNKYISSVGITGNAFEVIRNYIDENDPYPQPIYSDTIFGIAYDGSVTATKGNIGGFELGETYFRSIGEDSTNRYYCDIRSYEYNSSRLAIAIYYNEIGTNNWSAPFNVDYRGNLKAINAEIGPWTFNFQEIEAEYGNYKTYIQKPLSATHWIFSAQTYNNGGWYGTFYVQANGFCHMNYAECEELFTAKGGITISAGKFLYLPGIKPSSGTGELGIEASGRVVRTSSSKRYKENITSIIPKKLNPKGLYKTPVVVYNYKPEYKDKELREGLQIGITAEDLDQFYPNAVEYNEKGQPESWKSRILIPAMLKLIQEQHEEIEALKNYVYKKGA